MGWSGCVSSLREKKAKGLEMVDEGVCRGYRKYWETVVEIVARGIYCNQRPSVFPTAGNLFSQKRKKLAHLCDTLLMLPPEQDGPRNATRVLALQEEGLGFAILEAKDLAVATDIEFTLDDAHGLAGFFAQCGSICRCKGLLLLGVM